MKTLNYIVIGLMLTINQFAFGQLKITNQGFVGAGTNTPWERLHVASGSAIIANNGRSFRIYPWIGVSIGSNYGTISCWEIDSKWNQINAKKFYKVSDASLKTDVMPIDNPSQLISQLSGVYFRYKNDSVVLPINSTSSSSNEYDYGFIAQEVESILPEIVYNTELNVKAIDYNAITPILVEAFKQQMNVVDSLQQQIDSLTIKLDGCCNSSSLRTSNNTGGESNDGFLIENGTNNLGKLFQNQPNPFKETTIIKYEINDVNATAQIMIFDMQGTLIKNISLIKC